jgi:hypothetical protein
VGTNQCSHQKWLAECLVTGETWGRDHPLYRVATTSLMITGPQRAPSQAGGGGEDQVQVSSCISPRLVASMQASKTRNKHVIESCLLAGVGGTGFAVGELWRAVRSMNGRDPSIQCIHVAIPQTVQLPSTLPGQTTDAAKHKLSPQVSAAPRWGPEGASGKSPRILKSA